MLNEEYETARKKKGALDNLLKTGRISQSTYDVFGMEIAEAMTDIQRQQKALLQKMNAKTVELEEQIKTLEILLANFEIQHVTGEVEEEVYQREVNVLSMGLETTKHELEAIREALDRLSSSDALMKEEGELQSAENTEPKKEKQPKKSARAECSEMTEASSCEDEGEAVEAVVDSEPNPAIVESERKQKA
jgi:peptidoglycan hydrolase CwlO-like protein